MTPSGPDGDSSGAAMAPCETLSALTIWTRPVRNAAAVAFSASRGIVPSRVTRLLGIAVGDHGGELAAIGIRHPDHQS